MTASPYKATWPPKGSVLPHRELCNNPGCKRAIPDHSAYNTSLLARGGGDLA